MSGLDVSGLSPSDAVAALRSFPRRFGAVLALLDDEDDEVLRRPGPDGRSVLDHVDVAGRELAQWGDAVRRALELDRPTVVAAPVDPVPGTSAQAVLDRLALEANALADRAERVPAAEWSRPAEVDGRGVVAAIDLLREAVRSTAEHLHAAERARAGAV